MRSILNKLMLLAACAAMSAIGRADETITPTAGETAYTAKITVADGAVTTLDLTSYTGATPFRLSGGLYTQGTGSFVIKGATSILFGATAQPANDVHYPLLSADISFVDATDAAVNGTVILSGYATLERTSSPVEVEDGAWLALWGTDPLGIGANPFYIEKYNVYVLSGTAFNSGATLTVADGRTLRIKPCKHAGDYFTWSGDQNDTISNDIVLEEGSMLDLRGYAQLTLSGDISGTGTLIVKEGRGDANWVKLTGTVTLAGELEVGGNLYINQTTPGAAGNLVKVRGVNGSSAHTSLSLVPNGDTSVDTTATVDAFDGNHENALLYAQANQLMTANRFTGTGELRGRAMTSAFEIGTLAVGAKLYVRNCSKRVTVDAVEPQASVVARLKSGFEGEPVTLAFPTQQVCDSLTIENDVTVVLESGAFGDIVGSGKLVVRGQVKYDTIDSRIDVVVEQGAALTSLADGALESALGDLPALWLDASRADTLQEYTYNGHTVPEGTFPGIVVRRWDDCREGSERYFALNARSSTENSDGGFIRVMPYTITNELNGLSVVSFGTYQGAISGAANEINTSGVGQGSNKDSRRLLFNKPITAKMVIMVYGSQDGGGSALIGAGGDSAGNAEFKHLIGNEATEVEKSAQAAVYYARPGTTLEHRVLSSNKHIPFWMDGSSVYAYTSTLSGGYQILSMGVAPDDADPVLRSLGMSNTYSAAGGQRYAEVLIYTNDLTSVQRVAVEKYLARKWGLDASYSAAGQPKNVTLPAGAEFVADGRGELVLNGRGTLTVSDAATVKGSFAGTANVVEGATLTIPASTASIWTADEVAAVADRVGWFDPDCAADLLLDDKTGNDARPGNIHALFDHGNKNVANTPYLHGTYNGVLNERRPNLVTAARGLGPVRGWMDFYTDPLDAAKKGNNLRLKTNHNLATGADYSNTTLPVKTAFIVMDSCFGGGSPIIDKSTPGTVVKARDYANAASPIWGSGTGTIFTGGETRINGATVDGTATGFTGGPELFSFTTDGTQFNAAFFGNYNARGEGANEVLGEILLFSSVLDVETRAGVEAYLMKKWLGILPPGYTDWTGATVGGAGTVSVERQRDLPTFADFTGTLDLGAEALSFTLDGATKTVEGAVDVGGATLKLAAQGTIALSFKDGISKPGSYTLASFGTLAEPGISGWTLPARTSDGKFKLAFTADNDQLVARVLPAGLQIIIR